MRVFLTVILPLLLPTLAFLLWAVATRGRLPDLRDTAWLWSVGGGLVLLGIALAVFGVGERAPPGSLYAPAELRDGAVVPGRIEPAQ